jgi:hypothetical protein
MIQIDDDGFVSHLADPHLNSLSLRAFRHEHGAGFQYGKFLLENCTPFDSVATKADIVATREAQ